jgi:uncharacterized membrane protein
VTVGVDSHRAFARRGVLAALLLLAAASAGAVVLSSSGRPSAILAVALIAPLLAPLPGIARGDRRTHAWATLCVLPGFVYGLTEVVANPALRPIAALVLGASLALFIALVAYLRVTRPRQAPQSPPTP